MQFEADGKLVPDDFFWSFFVLFFALDDFPPQILASPLPLMSNFPKLPISILLPNNSGAFLNLEMCRCERNKKTKSGEHRIRTALKGAAGSVDHPERVPVSSGYWPNTQQYGVLIFPLVMLFECCALGNVFLFERMEDGFVFCFLFFLWSHRQDCVENVYASPLEPNLSVSSKSLNAA